jgi:hypothetical protein
MALLEAFVVHYVQEAISGEFRREDEPALPALMGTTSGDPAGVEAGLPAESMQQAPQLTIGQRDRWPLPASRDRIRRTTRTGIQGGCSGRLSRERREAEYRVLLGRSRDGFVGRVGFDLPVGGSDGH